jgi:hypothetical protein
MNPLALSSRYLLWHYSLGISDGASLALTALRLLAHTFSVPTLLATFFRPWKAEGETYPKDLSPTKFFEAFIVNTLMRIVGIIARSALLLMWLITTLCVLPILPLLFILWLLLPFIAIGIILLGFFILFL